mgnify:CR=1 FL=1
MLTSHTRQRLDGTFYAARRRRRYQPAAARVSSAVDGSGLQVGLQVRRFIAVAHRFPEQQFAPLVTAVFGAALLVSSQRLPARGVANVLLVLGLTSAFYALLDIRSDILSRPHIRSDAAMLFELTGVHTLVWGILWIGLAAFACWIALRRWLRRA